MNPTQYPNGEFPGKIAAGKSAKFRKPPHRNVPRYTTPKIFEPPRKVEAGYRWEVFYAFKVTPSEHNDKRYILEGWFARDVKTQTPCSPTTFTTNNLDSWCEDLYGISLIEDYDYASDRRDDVLAKNGSHEPFPRYMLEHNSVTFGFVLLLGYKKGYKKPSALVCIAPFETCLGQIMFIDGHTKLCRIENILINEKGYTTYRMTPFTFDGKAQRPFYVEFTNTHEDSKAYETGEWFMTNHQLFKASQDFNVPAWVVFTPKSSKVVGKYNGEPLLQSDWATGRVAPYWEGSDRVLLFNSVRAQDVVTDAKVYFEKLGIKEVE